MRPPTLKPAAELAAGKRHGTRTCYVSGCKCFKCRQANANYQTGRAHAIKAGDTRKLVSAARARRHMAMLSRRGVGRRTVAACSSVADTTLGYIKSGKKRQIRENTERAILAVTPKQLPDSHRVSGAGTRRRIAALLEEGYSKAALARMLKRKTPTLQIGIRENVTVKNRAQVLALYRRLMS